MLYYSSVHHQYNLETVNYDKYNITFTKCISLVITYLLWMQYSTYFDQNINTYFGTNYHHLTSLIIRVCYLSQMNYIVIFTLHIV